MNEQFNSYLIIILIIVLILTVPVIMLLKAGKRRKISRIDPVDGGSASIFFDYSGNVVIIPYVKDRYGSGRATSRVEFLRMPYKQKRLGSLLRYALKNCRNCEPCDTKQLMEILGAKDWNGFTEGRRNVSVHFKEGHGIVFNPTRNNGNGAFEFSGRGQSKMLRPEANDEALGAALLELLRYCR